MRMAIVDDRKADRDILRGKLVQGSHSYMPLIDEFDSGESFLQAHVPGKYAVVFLDCYMGAVSGMDAAKALRASGDECAIVFTTNSRDFAIEGYTVKAAGYLLKPYNDEALTRVLNSIISEKEEPFVLLPIGSEPTKVYLSHLRWCSTQSHCVVLDIAGQEPVRLRMSFAALEALLAPYKQFLCCYRGCLVNLDHVKALTNTDFILFDGQLIPVRQRELTAIRRQYNDYLFARLRKELP